MCVQRFPDIDRTSPLMMDAATLTAATVSTTTPDTTAATTAVSSAAASAAASSAGTAIDDESGLLAVDDAAKIARVYRSTPPSPPPSKINHHTITGTENSTEGLFQVSTLITLLSQTQIERLTGQAFWTLYFICAAIRSNVGLALTMNSEQGHSLAQRLQLTDKQVSTGLALFYVCYVVFDVPANLLMTRLAPHVWMARIVVGVGVIGCCHAALSAAWNF